METVLDHECLGQGHCVTSKTDVRSSPVFGGVRTCGSLNRGEGAQALARAQPVLQILWSSGYGPGRGTYSTQI